MVALQKAQIQNSVETVEELATWCASILYERHGADRVAEVENSSLYPAVEYQLINSPNGVLRLVVRLSIEMDRGVLTSSTQPIWKYTKPFAGNLTLPPGYAQAV